MANGDRGRLREKLEYLCSMKAEVVAEFEADIDALRRSLHLMEEDVHM